MDYRRPQKRFFLGLLKNSFVLAHARNNLAVEYGANIALFKGNGANRYLKRGGKFFGRLAGVFVGRAFGSFLVIGLFPKNKSFGQTLSKIIKFGFKTSFERLKGVLKV